MSYEETKTRREDALIPNTQIESMFLRVCSDDQMQQYVKLCDNGHISLATAYASNIVYKIFYALLDDFESQGKTIDKLNGKKYKTV